MNDSFKIISGTEIKPIYAIIYGPAGLGKTSFIGGYYNKSGIKVEGAKDAILIGPENKSEALCKKMPVPKDFTTFVKQIKWLRANAKKEGIKTIGVDSLDHIQILLHKEIMDNAKVKSIDQVGNYGAGYKIAISQLISLEKLFFEFIEDGINVIYTAHASMRNISDPMLGASYDTYEMALHKSATGKIDYSKIFIEKVSTVLFANVEKFLNKDGYAQTTENRKLYTESMPGFVAKNRYSLPSNMNLDYQEFVTGVRNFYNFK